MCLDKNYISMHVWMLLKISLKVVITANSNWMITKYEGVFSSIIWSYIKSVN